jgi:hypothetical protein
MFGQIWFIGFGIVLVVLPFTRAPRIRWTRGGGPLHTMHRWERVLTFALGVCSICVGLFAPFA